MMADAASLMESIGYLFRNYRKTSARASGEFAPTFFDSLYSFAARRGAVSKSKVVLTPQTATQGQGQGQQLGQQDQFVAQFRGSSRQLGQWDLAGLSGVSAMHATLIPNSNKIVFLEKVEKNSHARLKENPTKYSWSVEYDIEEATFRSLNTNTNMFCSAGGYRPDGTIVSLGGAEAQSGIGEGWNSLRFLASCKDEDSKCDWDTRDDITLTTGRWYPTVETLADGRLFIFGGSTRGASMNSKEIGVPSWELYPPLPQNPTHFPFLDETLPYNLYPMAHLLPDGNLFIFANKNAILFSTKTWSVIKNYPDLPGPPRNYPLSGGSVLLPLRPENNYEPEVMVCGGATDFNSRATGQEQCGRIKPLSQNPEWVMETMPLGRLMPDITLVHDGSVLIMNGANRGTAGYGRASEPVLQPVLYQPWATSSRFTIQNPSYIPRLYHSVVIPVLDGRVMVTGSNPNANTLSWSEYPVEYRVEMFSPGYLFSDTPRPLLRAEKTIGRTIHRPAALTVQALQAAKKSPEQGQGDGNTNENVIAFDTVFEIEVQFYGGSMTESQVVTPKSSNENTTPSRVQVNLLNGGFVTHSTHMSQRLVGLEIVGYVQKEGGLDRLKVKGPKDGALTPPGWYQMAVVENGIPSEATWVRVLQKQ
ncbi:hypothetical protein BGZ51_006879 [Haplosporangium sp. Z 767]|nr:hypothetical protein BGZ50_000196 [Haplosporangium sp. Z 11]KAF9191660.1 hypothetical protein BGZ51_006879 [Haplosporangium sp. Z 767]